MKLRKAFRCLLLGVLGLGCSGSWAADLGRVAFVGDSITQGFDSSINASPQASYRYQFWKGLVDNGLAYGEDYSFTGSQTGSCYKGASDLIASQTPDYLGQSFTNIHEGHFNWTASYISGTAAPPAADLQQNRGTGNVSQWLNPENPNGYTADTVFIMLGTNDLYKGRSTDQLLGDILSIVDAYQHSNENARIYVLSITPPSASAETTMMNRVRTANAAMESQASSWSTGTSSVSYLNVAEGMSSVSSGSQLAPGLMNIDRWHPNKQGELIIAGNILKGLGMDSQTGGLQRRSAGEFAKHASFTAGSPPSMPASQIALANGSDASAWNFSATGATLSWTNVQKGPGPALQGDWQAGGNDFSLDFRINMDPAGGTDNTFSVQLGNGTAFNGLLNICRQGVFWGSTLLYSDNMEEGFRNIRISYTQGDAAQGILSGYYVWLDGQMIGNGLQGDSSSGKDDLFLMGALDGTLLSSATLEDISYDVSGAYALEAKTVPEPSSVFLGILSLAWIGLRRKVKR